MSTWQELIENRKRKETSFSNKRNCRGFTLLEMTVVIAIVSIMTTVILMNLPSMKGGLSVDVIAQEVAIYIRGAQVYSRATRVASGENPQFLSFGLKFEKNSGNFSLHTVSDEEIGGNELMTSPVVESYSLPQGFLFSALVTQGPGNSTHCVDRLDVMFKKPDTEAHFACGPLCQESPTKPQTVWIKLVSANRVQARFVRVSNNGQIVVLPATSLKDSVGYEVNCAN